tara:strand:- start:139 stop:756 length:618 start_codon:yes stop_codon:yes gene_type:complete
MTSIGYFGDSFCESQANDSWCVLLAKQLNAEVVNWGKGGASVWTTFMEYETLKKINKIPDVSVFCWTEPYRLYHPTLPIAKGAVPIPGEDKEIYKAADMYYVYLQDYRKEELAYSYALQWFDRHVLSKNAKKVLQTWSMKPFELARTNVDIELTSGKFLNESMLDFAWGGKTPKPGFKFDISLSNHMTSEQNKKWCAKMFEAISQ